MDLLTDLICDIVLIVTITLLLLMFRPELVLMATPIGRQREGWNIPWSMFTPLIWLLIKLEAPDNTYEEVIEATHNISMPDRRHRSPQLNIFPKIRYPSGMKKPTDTGDLQFLNLPLEIRLMVYEFFFATEIYKPFEVSRDVSSVCQAATFIPSPFLALTKLTSYWPLVQIQHSKQARATANSKLPLLLANKAINAEARPLFYRHHTFRFDCRNDSWSPFFPGGRWKTREFDWMTRIELTNFNQDLSYQLHWLDMFCSGLKSLKVECRMTEEGEPLSHHPGLWARLVLIQIRFMTLRPDRLQKELMAVCLQSIAPMEDWTRIGVGELAGYELRRSNIASILFHDMSQYIYKLDRSSSR